MVTSVCPSIVSPRTLSPSIVSNRIVVNVSSVDVGRSSHPPCCNPQAPPGHKVSQIQGLGFMKVGEVGKEKRALKSHSVREEKLLLTLEKDVNLDRLSAFIRDLW